MASTKRAEAKEGRITVSSTVVTSADGTKNYVHMPTKHAKVDVRPFATDTATVSCKKGVTLDAGSYQSMRIDVMVSFPCYSEEAARVYAGISDLVDDLLLQEIEEMRDTMEGISG